MTRFASAPSWRSALAAFVVAAAGCGGGGAWPDDAGTSDAAGRCGGGLHDPGEECDDGNHADGDGCSSECAHELGALCDPCVRDSDCVGADTWCVPLASGGRCGQSCATSPCPTGFECTTVRRTGASSSQCVPIEGACLGCLDADGDGVCNSIDVCPGHDDAMDADGDGRPDGCDPCPADAPPDDADGDGVCDSVDACPGHDDHADADGDGAPDDCDRCAGRPDSIVFSDPGFVDPSAWTISGSASVEPTAAGRGGAGVGAVIFDSVCLGGHGSLAADGCAPVAGAGPQQMRVATSWQCSSGTSCQPPYFTVSSGPDSRTFGGSAIGSVPGVWADLSVCLGEAASLGPVRASIEAGSDAYDSPCPTRVELDDLVIEDAPPGACPSVGTVLNGNLEGASGWSPMHVVVDGGNRVIHLQDAAGCASGAFHTAGLVSIPLAATVPHAALSMRTRGALPQGGAFHIDVVGTSTTRILSATSLTSTWSTQHVCLPASAAGAVAVLSMGFDNNDCGRTLPLDAWLDDLAVVSDPVRCP